MDSWDSAAFKTLLRTTSQRLGQLQERNDSQGKLVRRDIATHLSQGHLALARTKAATLMQEDTMGDLLEELEMLVGTVGSHIGELGSSMWRLGLREEDVNEEVEGRTENRQHNHVGRPPRLSPALVEAAASIIHAAPSTESKDLHTVREILIRQLGPVFAQTASANRNNRVSSRIMQILSSSSPTASRMDEYLANIAQTYHVRWVPEPPREDLVNVISEILHVDPSSSPIVDLPRLREICARGLPDDPPWVRPRMWRLLFGTLPVLKTMWNKESQKQRDSYYDLVRRLLAPLASLPTATDPFSPTDALLSRLSDSLFSVSPELFVLLGNEPKNTHSGKCPLDPNAPDAIRISCATNLDKRLALLKDESDVCKTPEIRLESDPNASSDTIPSAAVAFAPRRQRRPTTLLPSKAYNAPPAHHAHLSALLRLLYIHSMLNPAVQSPHVPWLLVPIYSALVGETDEGDAAHAEADAFWVFEALIGEIGEMEEEDGRRVWTKKLSERLKWADGELAASLHATGLDPALPHYSYRWLAPLLVQTLPLSSVLPVWDVIFSRPTRTRDVNSKLEHLVDICTALLVRARTPLFRLGKPGRDAQGLWVQEQALHRPPSPLRPWELSDAFTEGIALLTSYPINAAGGIDRVLQTALDLSQKRMEAMDRERERERENVGFGTRIKQQIWKGFTNQVADGSPDEEEVEEGEEEEEEEKIKDDTGEHDDGNETETPSVPTLTSRLATTVWRGITNQSSMDDEVPSPPSPLSARQSPTLEEQEKSSVDLSQSPPPSQASLWDYAGKLRNSDTVAAFSKVSTNWRAKALDAWRVRKDSNASTTSAPVASGRLTPTSVMSEVVSPRHGGSLDLGGEGATSHRRGSLPGEGNPPRPAFFRSPRESFLPQPRRQHSTAPPSPNVNPTALDVSRGSDNDSSISFIHRAGASIASLTTLQSSHPTPKSVPKPLMLSSRDLITNKPSTLPFSSARSEGSTPELRGGVSQWGEVLSAAPNRHAFKQESVSSTSSIPHSEASSRSSRYPFTGRYPWSARTAPRSDYESDGSVTGTSRRVPLNRKSVSPMALASRAPHLPWNASPVSGGLRSPGHPLSNGSVTAEDMETESERGSRHSMEQIGTGRISTGTGTGFDSPTTVASPPIPPTPLMPAVQGLGIVRIVNGGAGERGHGGTSSISTLSEASDVNAATPLVPPAPNRLVVRKKTPPLPTSATLQSSDKKIIRDDGCEKACLSMSPSESEQSELERTPSGKTSPGVVKMMRSKRYVPRPANLHLRPMMGTGMGGGCDQQQQQQQQQQDKTPSPRQRIIREWPSEGDLSTPHATGSCPRDMDEEDASDECLSGGVLSRAVPFTRKPSKEARLRKISTGSRETRRAARDSGTSGAEEGDDEGYDELLSAYESEEGSRE